MTNKTKSVLLRTGLAFSVAFVILSIPITFVINVLHPNSQYSILVFFVPGIIATVSLLWFLEKVEAQIPRKVPTHQLLGNMSRPPSHDEVTIPTNKDLWHVPLYVIPIVATPLLVFGYKFGTSPYIDWFPVIICLMVLVYMYEAIRGPLRRWWIANVFGEWSGQKWSDTTNAEVIYLIDTSNAWQADTQRLFSFYGRPILFSRFWLELYVPEIKVVGYLKISHKVFQELAKNDSEHCLIQYRNSKLHLDRLQLRMT